MGGFGHPVRDVLSLQKTLGLGWRNVCKRMGHRLYVLEMLKRMSATTTKMLFLGGHKLLWCTSSVLHFFTSLHYFTSSVHFPLLGSSPPTPPPKKIGLSYTGCLIPPNFSRASSWNPYPDPSAGPPPWDPVLDPPSPHPRDLSSEKEA